MKYLVYRQISILILAISIFSCSHNVNEIPSDIEKAMDIVDSLSMTEPRKADYFLDSIKGQALNAGETAVMKWKLLRIKTDDKLDQLKPVESLLSLDTIENFYSKKNSEKELFETYYYKGRSHSDIFDSKKAIEFFNKALMIDEKDSTTSDFKSIVHSQLGYLYARIGDYHNAVIHDKHSLEFAYKTNDIKSIIRTEMCLGSSYESLDSLDKADFLFSKALYHAKGINNPYLIQRAVIHKAYILLKKGKISEIDSLWNPVKDLVPQENKSDLVLLFEAELYKVHGELDSAADIFSRLAIGGLDIRRLKANRELFIYYIEKGELDNARKYALRALDIQDSILSLLPNTNHDAEMMNLYRLHDYELAKSKSQCDRLNVLIYILSFLLLAITLASFFIHRKKLPIIGNYINHCRQKQNRLIDEGVDINKQEVITEGAAADKEIAVFSTLNSIRKQIMNTHKLSQLEWNELEKIVCSSFKEFSKFIMDYNLSGEELKVCLLTKIGCSNKDSNYSAIGKAGIGI